MGSPPPPPAGFFPAADVPEGEYSFLARRVHPSAYIPEGMEDNVPSLRNTGVTPGNAGIWAALHVGQENQRRQAEGKHNLDPDTQLAIQDIYKRMAGRGDVSSQNFYEQTRQRQADDRGNTLGGRVQDASGAFTGNLANTGLDILGLAAPQTANRLSQATDEQYRTGQAYDNAINPVNAGNLAAEAVKMATVARAGPGGMAAFYGTQGAGGQRREVATLRDQGNDISGLNEALTTFGVGATEAISGYIGGRIFRSMGGVLKGAAPEFRAALASGFRPAVTEAIRQTAMVSGHALAEGTEEAVTQAVTNLIRQGVNPEQAIAEGLAESFTMGVLLSPFGAGNIDAGRGREGVDPAGAAQGTAPAGAGAMQAQPAQLAEEFQNRIQRRLAEAQGPDDVGQAAVTELQPDVNTDPTRRLDPQPDAEAVYDLTPGGQEPAPPSFLQQTGQAPDIAGGPLTAPPSVAGEPSAVNPLAQAGQDSVQGVQPNIAGPQAGSPQTGSPGVAGQGQVPLPQSASRDEIAALVASSDPDVVSGGLPADIVTQGFAGEMANLKNGDQDFELVDVPVSLVRQQSDYQPEQVAAYAQQPAESAPPGVGGFTKFGDFALVDGNTRARAAAQRGDATVRAYVPKSDAEQIRKRFADQQRAQRAEESVEQLYDEARTDPLTDLGNKRRFDEAVQDAQSMADESGEPFSMIVMDAANLKAANTAFGHQGADEKLRAMAQAIAEVTRQGNDGRPVDMISTRQGGDEFAVILPGANQAEAEMVLKRIQEVAGREEIVPGVSMFLAGGTSEYAPGSGDVKSVIKAADDSAEQRKEQSKRDAGEVTSRQDAERLVQEGVMKGIFKQEVKPEDTPTLPQPKAPSAKKTPTTKADRDDAKIKAKFADTESQQLFAEEAEDQADDEPITDPNEDPNLPDDLLDQVAKMGWEPDATRTRLEAKMGNSPEVRRSMMRLPGPELLKLAQAVLGSTPGVKRMIGRPRVLGWFKPDINGVGEMNINPTIGRNEVLLAKVLAHELGHVIDHVPDSGIESRPNIISRLRGMRDDIKEALGHPVGDVKKELIALTTAWSGPIAPGNSKHSVYRRSDAEIYAEFLSVFLSDPAMAQRKAPKAFEIFMAHVNNKPDFADNYIAIQDMLDGQSEEAIAARQADIRGDFKKGNERMQIAAEANRARAQDPWENFLQATLDSATPLMKLEKDDTGSWKGSHIDMASDEYAMVDQETQIMLDDVRAALKPALNAGIDTGVMGEWLMMNRIAYGDRSRMKDLDKAIKLGLDPKDLNNRDQAYINPRGYGPTSAKQNLDAIEKTLGKEKADILKKSMETFLDMPYQMAEKLHREGAMTDGMFEIIEANRGNYVTFAVLDYLDASIPAAIRKQIGTFKPIANPLVATTMKMMSQARLYETQRYKNAVVQRLSGSKEITRLRVAPGGNPKAPPPFMDNFMHLVNGRPVWFQAHERFVRSLKRKNIGDLSFMNQLASKYTYGIFHKVFVQLNMSWMIANLPRDFMRTYKNLKGIDRSITFAELLKAYTSSVKPAYLKEKGIFTDEVRALVESRGLAAVQMGELQKARESGEYEQLLIEEFGDIQKARKGLLGRIAGLQDVLITLGNTTESMSKIAGEKVLMGRISDSKARAHIIRNKVGTPNIYRKGTVTSLTNTLFMYSKVAIAGYRADFDSAFSKKSAGGWWEGHMRFIGIPRILMWMAANGFLGELLEEWFDKIPDYDKTNYLIVPMGESTDGKVRYMRIPMDHTDLLVSGTMWRMMDTMKQDQDDSFEKDMKDMAHFFKSQIPGFSPPIEMANAWTQYATGANPYDSWQRRPIMSPDEHRAGGKYAFNSMVQWTADQFGIASQVLDVIPHFNESQGSQAPRVVNYFPGMSRFIRESDRGLDQERWSREEVEEMESARFRMGLPDGVRDILQARNRLVRFSGGREKSELSREEIRTKAIYDDFYGDYLSLTDAIKVSESRGEQERADRLRQRLGEMATSIQERVEALGAPE